MSGALPLLPLRNFTASNMKTYHLSFEVVFCSLSNVLLFVNTVAWLEHKMCICVEVSM